MKSVVKTILCQVGGHLGTESAFIKKGSQGMGSQKEGREGRERPDGSAPPRHTSLFSDRHLLELRAWWTLCGSTWWQVAHLDQALHTAEPEPGSSQRKQPTQRSAPSHTGLRGISTWPTAEHTAGPHGMSVDLSQVLLKGTEAQRGEGIFPRSHSQ